MKRLAAVLICIILGLTLSGCMGVKETQDYKPGPDFAPLTEIAEGRKNFYLIVKNLDSSYWQVIIDGAKDGGEAFNCNVFYSGSYTETDWQSQERLLQEAADAGADAILVAPNDSVKLAEKIDEIYNKGIHIILIDTAANTDNYDVCYMTDNLMAGQQAAKEMIYQLKKSGNADTDSVQIGLQVGSTSSQTITDRLAGFFQYWTRNAPEKWEVISDIKCNDGYIDKAIECAEELLEYPNIKGVFGTNNGSTVGFATAVKEQERKDIVVIGFDYSDEIAELINDDEYNASTILQKQYYMSYSGIKTASELTDGKKIFVKFEDTGVIVVNKETRDTSEVQDALLHN